MEEPTRYRAYETWEAGPVGRAAWRIYDARTGHSRGPYPSEAEAKHEAARLNQRIADAVENAARYRIVRSTDHA